MTTPSVDAASLDRPQRQSPLAVLLLAVRSIRQIGFVQIAIFAGFILTRVQSLVALALLVLFVAMIALVIAGLQWWRYTFAVVDGELHVHRGVLSQQNLTIPLERVQSVALEQQLLHRLASLVQVSIDTAGTSSAEFTIDAVEVRVAEALQRVAADHRHHAPLTGDRGEQGGDGDGVVTPPPPVVDRVLVRHDAKRVLLVALTQMPLTGLVLLAPLLTLGDDIGQVIPFDLPTIDEPAAGWWLAWAIPAVLFIGLTISVVLNLARVLLTNWNLTLTATPNGLRRKAGLLSTTSVASSVPRVQRVTVTQGVLERLASLQTMRLDTVGVGGLAIPGCESSDVEQIREIVLGDGAIDHSLQRLVSPQVVFQLTRNASVFALVVAAAMYFVVGWWALLVLLLVPYVWLSARRRARLRRWDVTRYAIADRREYLGWSRDELLLHKVNGASVRQSLFERKRGLATVHLASAKGNVAVGMLPLADARSVRDLALYVSETDKQPWM